MMKRIFICAFYVFTFSSTIHAQTQEELLVKKAELQAVVSDLNGQLSTIKGDIAGIDALLAKFPKWELGAAGLVGVDIKGFNNWVTKQDANSSATSIGFSLNGFAHYSSDKFFWRNSGKINLGWLKYVKDRDAGEDISFDKTADVLSLRSLYGRNFSKKLAFSTLVDFRTTLLDNFNNPGYLDFGTGITYKPSANLIVVAHPLNYNLVISKEESDFVSSLGAKIVADYYRKIHEGLRYESNLSAFASYRDLSGLSNWTWTNGLNFTAWKGIGIGLEFAIRKNVQEIDDLQSYWLIGISYSL